MAEGGNGSQPNCPYNIATIRVALSVADINGTPDWRVARRLKVATSIVSKVRDEGEAIGALGEDAARLSTVQAAWVCGVEARRFRQFVDSGRIEPIFPDNRNKVFRRTDVVKFASTPRRSGRRNAR